MTFEARVGYDHPLRNLGRTGVLRGSSTGTGYVAFETIDPGAVVGVGLGARVADPLSVRLLASLFVEATTSVGGSGADWPRFIEGTVPPDTLDRPGTQVDLGLTVGGRFRVW